MKNQISDAGRSLCHATETNDCSVIAMAHTANVDYATAHLWARRCGRRDRHGMRTYQVHDMIGLAQREGKIEARVIPVVMPTRVSVDEVARFSMVTRQWVRPRRFRRKGMTVASFLCTLPKKGRFYLGCTTHAFAVVDGVVLDNLYRPKMRATMDMAYEIIPKAQQPVMQPNAPTTKAPEMTQADINAMWERLSKIKF